jgi:hypothetical protein
MKARCLASLLLFGTALAAPDWETWVRSDGTMFEARVRQVEPGTAIFQLRAGGEQTLAPAQLAERSRRRLAEVLGLLPGATQVAAAPSKPSAPTLSPAPANSLDASDAGALESRFGQSTTVTGTVRRVATLGGSGHRLLEFEGEVFSVFIRRSDLERHPDWPLDALTGRRVRVLGEIGKFRDRLQIQVSKPTSLQPLE